MSDGVPAGNQILINKPGLKSRSFRLEGSVGIEVPISQCDLAELSDCDDIVYELLGEVTEVRLFFSGGTKKQVQRVSMLKERLLDGLADDVKLHEDIKDGHIVITYNHQRGL